MLCNGECRVQISHHLHRREGRSIEFYFPLLQAEGKTSLRREERSIEYYSRTASVCEIRTLGEWIVY